MKLKIGLFLAVLAAMIPGANAVIVNVDVGDRPYYLHGPGYYVGRTYYVWVPGHWRWYHHRRVWVHGHYVRR
jgi:WXXGXW repeat (2 copies)